MNLPSCTVSVHIVTFNSEKDIADCLSSVFAQSLSPHEVIVIDNGSSDQTLEAITDYAVRCVLNSSNTGFAVAHNAAIRLSSSDYVVVLNPDVTLHPDYLLHAVGFLQNHPSVGSVTGLLLRKEDGEQIDSSGIRILKSRKAMDRTFSGALPEEVFGISGAAAVYRRSMINEVSYQGQFFDEDFFAYKEDVDVSWRARIMGWESFFVPAAVGYHERGWKKGGRFSKPAFLRKHSYINRYRMLIKNESMLYFMRHFPSILLYELASLGYVIFRDPRLIAAWLDLLRDLKKLLQQRRWIQQRRKVDLKCVYKYFE